MMPAAFAISLYHYGAIALDSVPQFGHVVGSWRVPQLPGGYGAMEQSIILAAVGVFGAQPLIRRIFGK